jgi:starvation-inducible DNA-binding protein
MSLEFQNPLGFPMAKLLASTYMLYLKTQFYHWNVSSMHFYSLHKMFEAQYEQLAEASDTIAERILALGDKAPGSFAAFLELSILEEDTEVVGATEMIRNLLADHQAVAELCHEVIDFAEEQHDHVTADVVTQRLTQHETTAWMLRSSLS